MLTIHPGIHDLYDPVSIDGQLHLFKRYCFHTRSFCGGGYAIRCHTPKHFSKFFSPPNSEKTEQILRSPLDSESERVFMRIKMDASGDRSDRRKEIFSTLELLCVFFWFLLDGFWLMEWRTLTCLFSVLALGAAAAMFLYVKKERALIFVTCADTSWLICNVTWAVGDLAYRPQSASRNGFFSLACFSAPAPSTPLTNAASSL